VEWSYLRISVAYAYHGHRAKKIIDTDKMFLPGITEKEVSTL
jgi:hypothetical protein